MTAEQAEVGEPMLNIERKAQEPCTVRTPQTAREELTLHTLGERGVWEMGVCGPLKGNQAKAEASVPHLNSSGQQAAGRVDLPCYI